jgi:DNA-binding XRE family transcriptional regulator
MYARPHPPLRFSWFVTTQETRRAIVCYPRGLDLKLMRVRSGVRQYRVAQLLGMPPSTLCDIENGRRAIGPRLAARIAGAIEELGCEPQEGGRSGLLG